MILDNNTGVLENFLLVIYNCFMDIQIYEDDQSLHEALSENGTLPFNTVGAILHGLGFKFSIELLESTPQ